LLPESLLPKNEQEDKHGGKKPRKALGTNPAMKAGQRPPAIQDEWAKEPE
jgi:hypothetical protein